MPVAKKILERYLETEALTVGFFGASLFGICIIRLTFDLVVTLTDSCNYIESFAQEHFMERCIPIQFLLFMLTICVINFTAYALFIRGIAKRFHRIMIPLITVSSLQTLLTGLCLIYAIVIKSWDFAIGFSVAFPLSLGFLVISYFMYKKILLENS
ncbi:hypothetical protein ACKWTF_011680 [Chironomus riparius]